MFDKKTCLQWAPALGLCAVSAVALTYAIVQAQPSAPTALERKIGQMIVVGFEGTAIGDDGAEAIRRQIARGTIGGVLLLERNFNSEDQLHHLTQELTRAGDGPMPLIAMDPDGAGIQRLNPPSDGLLWRSAEELGVAADAEQGFRHGYYTTDGRQLVKLGDTVPLGAVADIDTLHANRIIGSFVDMVNANPDATVTPTAATAQRSEATVAMAHLLAPEWIDCPDRETPERARVAIAKSGLAEKTPVFRRIEGDKPASSSPTSFEDLAIKAVLAGSEILVIADPHLDDPTIGATINRALANAVEEDRIPMALIDAAHDRILIQKARLGPVPLN